MTTAKALPDLDRLNELLSYDGATGEFRWKVSTSNRAPVGSLAGCIAPNGYRYIRVDNKLYLAHRIALFMATGEQAPDVVDHMDGNPLNNALSNLRAVDHRANCENRKKASSSTGVLGVCRSRGKYFAQIQTRGKHLNLGRHDTLEAAHAAYLSAKMAMHEGYVA